MAEVNKSVFEKGTDYAGKSDKKEKPKLDPILDESKIASTKKPFMKRMIKFFLDEDVDDVKEYIIKELILPEIKETGRGILAGMFGIDYKRNSSRSNSGYHRDYRAYYGGGSSKKNSPKRESKNDDDIDYRNIVLVNRRDAEDLVDRMREQIDREGSISVAEFFNLLHLPSEWTDSDWGWTSPNDIGIKKVHNGFKICVREAERID